MAKRKVKAVEVPKPKEYDKPKKAKSITYPIDKDNIRKEKEDIEHVKRMVSIKHNSPNIVKVTKTVICEGKNILRAEYECEVKE